MLSFSFQYMHIQLETRFISLFHSLIADQQRSNPLWFPLSVVHLIFSYSRRDLLTELFCLIDSVCFCALLSGSYVHMKLAVIFSGAGTNGWTFRTLSITPKINKCQRYLGCWQVYLYNTWGFQLPSNCTFRSLYSAIKGIQSLVCLALRGSIPSCFYI